MTDIAFSPEARPSHVEPHPFSNCHGTDVVRDALPELPDFRPMPCADHLDDAPNTARRMAMVVAAVSIPYVHARTAGGSIQSSLCIAHALLHSQKVNLRFAHSFAGPQDILFHALRRQLAGP